jgi:3'-5' exoribonuclease
MGKAGILANSATVAVAAETSCFVAKFARIPPGIHLVAALFMVPAQVAGARMSRPKITLARLSELTAGQYADCYALLAEKKLKSTREGKPFYDCRFRDRRRVVACMVWGDGPWFAACEREWQEGRFYKLRVQYGEHEKYGPQIELQNIRPATELDGAEGFKPSDLVEASRFNADELFGQLLNLTETEIRDIPLRRLVRTLLERHEAKLKTLPASEKHFYPFAGGWVEHVCSVTRCCLWLADHYLAHYESAKPLFNRDLVVAGAMLHDIGRVLELSDDAALPQPTIPGRLSGHVVLGRDLVRDAARELGDVHPELVQLLEHIILTHLSLPEWGSPRLPLIPEVLILHHADDLDAKLEMYLRCLERDVTPGPFTAVDPLLKKPLLKQRGV